MAGRAVASDGISGDPHPAGQRIGQYAHDLHLQRGEQNGSERDAWLQAEAGIQAQDNEAQRNMEEKLQRLRVALRVLGAVTEFREPEETDIQTLRSYEPLFMRRPPDELACDVIQQTLKAKGGVSEGIAGKV